MGPFVANETRKAMGRSLRARRKTLGISMTAAAEAARMSRVTWHRLEKGESGVAWDFLLAAASALDLQLQLLPREPGAVERPSTRPPPSLDDWLPLEIALADFPGLHRLAWQLREGLDHVTPREAWGLYERNWRHLEVDALPRDERALITALGKIFGEMHAGI